MNRHYWEEYSVGQTFASASRTVDAAQIKAFAAEFDPQPFHLDEEAAAGTLFRGLAASGWHTAALTMRLIVDSDFRPAGGVIGAGGEEIRWPRPTRPGDVLSVRCEILETRASAKRPDQGLVKVRVDTHNGADEVVQTMVMNLLVQRRPVSTPSA